MSGDEKNLLWVLGIGFLTCLYLVFGDGVSGGWRVVGVLGILLIVFLFIWMMAGGDSCVRTGGDKRYGTHVDVRGRQRCNACKKVVLFGDYEAAEGAAQNALSRGTYLRSYYETRCRNWHLSSQRPR